MDQQGNVKDSARPLVSRRTVALGAAWSVPVIVMATAAPAAAASVENRQASLATATGDKGVAVGSNRQVTFILSFGSIVGSNSVAITSIDGGGPWAVLPTAAVTVDSAHPSAPFSLTRPDTNNSTLTVVLHYTVNGVESTVSVTVKNKVSRGRPPCRPCQQGMWSPVPGSPAPPGRRARPVLLRQQGSRSRPRRDR